MIDGDPDSLRLHRTVALMAAAVAEIQHAPLHKVIAALVVCLAAAVERARPSLSFFSYGSQVGACTLLGVHGCTSYLP